MKRAAALSLALWFAAFPFLACTSDELAAARTASNAAADAISAESDRLAYAVALDGYKRMALCKPDDTPCKREAIDAAIDAGEPAMKRLDVAASAQRLLEHELDLAATCKAAGAPCYREAADAALDLAAKLAAPAVADAGTDGAP